MKHLALALLATTALAQPPGVLTKAYDNARSGTQTHESVLTQDAIAKHGLVLETTIPVYGDARGMEAQPLIAAGVNVPGDIIPCTGTAPQDRHPGAEPIYAVPAVAYPPCHAPAIVHDVMVLPSMANVVRGVDAETGAGLWQTTLGVPITSSGKIDFHQINQHWGCLSTGVIVGTRWYGVCQVSTYGIGNPASGSYFMFALNLADGSQVFIADVQGHDHSLWKQRSALTYLPKANVIAFAHGSVYETGGGNNGYTGGVTVFDLATNAVSAQLPLTSGIWMAGQGLVADADEYMYAITANGAFDPENGWYGESFIKMRYRPEIPSLPCKSGDSRCWVAGLSASLAVIDQWSPWTDAQRTGHAMATRSKLAGDSAPSEAVKPVGSGMSMPMAEARVEAAINAQGQVVARVYPTMAKGEWSDEDWGSAGPACLFSIGVCIATGKDGIGYPISSVSLGGTSLQTVGTPANYAKLAAPCAWLTMSPGPVPCDPADPRRLNFMPNGNSAHLHMTPVQMYDPLIKSWVLFVGGENSAVHKWAVGPTGKLKYIAEGHEYASQDVRNRPPGGMEGSFCSASSNGSDPNSMLLFCAQPLGDANATVTGGRLLVYDATHLAADGSLKLLWRSDQWGIQFTHSKFNAPVVWNGRVYLANYSGGVMVFGLGR